MYKQIQINAQSLVLIHSSFSSADYVEYVDYFMGGFQKQIYALCNNPVSHDPFSILVMERSGLTKTDGNNITSGRTICAHTLSVDFLIIYMFQWLAFPQHQDMLKESEMWPVSNTHLT